MSRKIPDVWAELAVQAYPIVSGGTSILRMGNHPMAFPRFVEGRVMQWSEFELALSDWRGNQEAAVLTGDVEDADGRLRAISASIGDTAFAKAELSLNWLSQQGRRALLTPRRIFRGFLTESPTPRANRKAGISATDAIGATFFHLDPQQQLIKATVDRAFLDAAGLVNTPKDNVGRVFPWYVGEHSTQGWTDINGNSAAIGMKPVFDLGDIVLTSSRTVDTSVTYRTEVPPPEIYEFGVVMGGVTYPSGSGAPGTATYYYSVNGLFPTGRTRASATIIVPNAPAVRTASDYVYIKFRPPSGWEDYYRNPNSVPTPFSFPSVEVNGRSNYPANLRLDVGGFLTGGGDVDEYHDDQDNDIEKGPGPPAVGEIYVITTEPGEPATITDSETYGVMMVNLGYNEQHKIYGADFTENAAAKRVLLDPEHPDIVWPGGSSWPHPHPWLEWGVPGDEIRWSGFFVKGNLLKHMRNGDVTFAVDGCGITDTGDETGTPVTEVSEGYILTINELVLRDNGRGYRKGNFSTSLATFSDGITILDTAIIRAFQTQTVGFIGGRGYQMHFAIVDQSTLDQYHQWVNTTYFSWTGPTNAGQLGLWTIPDLATNLATTRIFRRHIEIPGNLEDVDPADDEVENLILAKYDFNPDTGQYVGEPETFSDSKSQTLYGIRPAASEGSFVECRGTRDRATFLDAMSRRLYFNKIAPCYQPVPVGTIGFEQEMGSVFRVTHKDGNGLNGWVNAPMFLIRKRVNVNAPNQRVVMVGRDLSRAFSEFGDNVMNGTDAVLDFVML